MRYVRDVEAGGSNPLTPTIWSSEKPASSLGLRVFSRLHDPMGHTLIHGLSNGSIGQNLDRLTASCPSQDYHSQRSRQVSMRGGAGAARHTNVVAHCHTASTNHRGHPDQKFDGPPVFGIPLSQQSQLLLARKVST